MGVQLSRKAALLLIEMNAAVPDRCRNTRPSELMMQRQRYNTVKMMRCGFLQRRLFHTLRRALLIS